MDSVAIRQSVVDAPTLRLKLERTEISRHPLVTWAQCLTSHVTNYGEPWNSHMPVANTPTGHGRCDSIWQITMHCHWEAGTNCGRPVFRVLHDDFSGQVSNRFWKREQFLNVKIESCRAWQRFMLRSEASKFIKLLLSAWSHHGFGLGTPITVASLFTVVPDIHRRNQGPTNRILPRSVDHKYFPLYPAIV